MFGSLQAVLCCCCQSKQLSHARDMENLRAKAREEALEAAKQLEEVKLYNPSRFIFYIQR